MLGSSDLGGFRHAGLVSAAYYIRLYSGDTALDLDCKETSAHEGCAIQRLDSCDGSDAYQFNGWIDP